jgi:hypothetical protein
MFETAADLPGKAAGFGRLAVPNEFAEAQPRRLLQHAEQFATAQMVAERWQAARLDDDEQHKARPVLRRLPQRRIALQGRIGRLQIFVRHYTQYMVGRVVPGLHPGVDVIAGADLPFMHIGFVAKRLQLLGDPHRPVVVAAGVADKNIGHGLCSGAALSYWLMRQA